MDLPWRVVHCLVAERGFAKPRSRHARRWLSVAERSHERSVTLVCTLAGTEHRDFVVTVRRRAVDCARMEGRDPHQQVRGSRPKKDEGLVRDNFGSEDPGPRARERARDDEQRNPRPVERSGHRGQDALLRHRGGASRPRPASGSTRRPGPCGAARGAGQGRCVRASQVRVVGSHGHVVLRLGAGQGRAHQPASCRQWRPRRQVGEARARFGQAPGGEGGVEPPPVDAAGGPAAAHCGPAHAAAPARATRHVVGQRPSAAPAAP